MKNKVRFPQQVRFVSFDIIDVHAPATWQSLAVAGSEARSLRESAIDNRLKKIFPL